MRRLRALSFGIIGAGAISAASAGLRTIGIPIQLEMLLGSLPSIEPGPTAFIVGFLIHLAIGGAFGLLYGWLFETVWDHGGASTGMILGVIHAALIGMAVGLTPQFHPFVPERLSNPGPFFANIGPVGVVTFFAVHMLYGAIVGGGYGHVAAERQWSPTGRL